MIDPNDHDSDSPATAGENVTLTPASPPTDPAAMPEPCATAPAGDSPPDSLSVPCVSSVVGRPTTPSGDSAPDADYLPARMVNEFVYCPRLFYYEWVEAVFAHNRETVEGALRHQKLDQALDAMPTAEEAAESGETIHSRSVMLASDDHRLIARIDLVEGDEGVVMPVDYKRGSPRLAGPDGALAAWDPDRVQLAVQAIVLRANGYRCHDGIVYYNATKQRVRVAIDERLEQEALAAAAEARRVAAEGRIPPPLVDSPKCPRCSLVSICLPDETRVAAAAQSHSAPLQRLLFEIDEVPLAGDTAAVGEIETRRLVPARDDLRPVYLNTQGLRVGKSGNVLKVSERDQVVQEIRIGEICQLNLMGNVQLTTQALQTLCENEVPIAYFSQGGWFYGVTHGLGVRNIYLRKEQFRWADSPVFCLRLARSLVAGKIRNQRTMIQRNHVEPPAVALAHMKCMADDAQAAGSLEELLGIEGYAARLYFEHFAGMLKHEGADIGEPLQAKEWSFDFRNRNRRPPRDPVNALLSLAYSVLSKDLAIVCHAVGFDPFLGFYHQPRFGRAALALDLMEPFRPLIADSAVLSAINTRMLTLGDFVRVGPSAALRPAGRKAFFRAYEQRMDTLVTHPLFSYRVNYRRMLEIQARLLARVLTGELTTYPVFTTR